MKFTATCAQCSKSPEYRPSEFPDRPGAEAFVRRHRAIYPHHVTITERPAA